MGYYVYAPAGADSLQHDNLQKCIEYIGSFQKGHGSNKAKGIRYIKKKLKCSAAAIKRTISVYERTYKHDYQQYGLRVYYYHKEFCAQIISEIISFLMNNGMPCLAQIESISEKKGYINYLYRNQLVQLKWVLCVDYKFQGKDAEAILLDFKNMENGGVLK